MNEEKSQYRPIEPTTPVEARYSWPSYENMPLIPPPPPFTASLQLLPEKRRKRWLWLLAIPAVIFLLLASAVIGYVVAKIPFQTPQPMNAATTVQVNITSPTTVSYTAQDILNEMIAHNLTVVGSAYGTSLDYFFSDSFYSGAVSVPFQSSVVWSTWSGQTPGSCPDACVGLWVYSSPSLALSVKHMLVTDGAITTQTPMQGPTYYPDGIIQSGRCLAYPVAGTPYAKVVQQYCV